ncbi:MAG TPA: sulfatase, partial [Isosphaeraceae bacterium]|nr:sulfatase [Isosphaeraceae bacterium]
VGILHYLDSARPGSYLGELQMSRHFPWMLPLAQAAIFGGMGLVLAGVAWVRPRLGWKVASVGLLTLAAYALLSMIDGLYEVAALALAVGVGLRFGTWLSRKPRGFRKVAGWTAPVLLGLVGSMGLWVHAQEVRQQRAERLAQAALPPVPAGSPNVLLIVLDTVRADHLSLYGYDRETTPRLDALARGGVTFEMARSPAPWTLPAHASIFTGRWPNELHIGTPSQPLDATYPTLAEFFASQGYETAGFVGNTNYCNTWFGLNRGFQHYEDFYDKNSDISVMSALRSSYLGRKAVSLVVEPPYNARSDSPNPPKDARKINRDFGRWLEGRQDRPFFAFLNYFDAHDPYLTPPDSHKHFGVVPESDEDRDRIRFWDKFMVDHAQNLALAPPERDLALAKDAYDDSLYALDERLGELFDALERQGILQNTIVVVTSDHGEEFGAHNLYGHGMSLHRGQVHVPLMIVAPKGVPHGRKVPEVVSTRSIAATLADLTGLSERSPFPGRSLVPYWDDSREPEPLEDDEIASILSILNHPLSQPRPNVAPSHNGTLTSFVLDGKVYIRDDFGREQLFDLRTDPDEEQNLIDQADLKPVVERARRAWEAFWSAPTSRPVCPVSIGRPVLAETGSGETHAS